MEAINSVEENLLNEILDSEQMQKGAYNIRKNNDTWKSICKNNL